MMPFQGEGGGMNSIPRALPWANLFRPFRPIYECARYRVIENARTRCSQEPMLRGTVKLAMLFWSESLPSSCHNVWVLLCCYAPPRSLAERATTKHLANGYGPGFQPFVLFVLLFMGLRPMLVSIRAVGPLLGCLAADRLREERREQTRSGSAQASMRSPQGRYRGVR